MFDLLATKLNCFKPYLTANLHFPFLNAKIPCFQLHCTTNMCSLVFCKIALFPALLQREKMFCKAAASDADFDLILLKTTFLLVFG